MQDRIFATSLVGSVSLPELHRTPLQGTAPPDRIKKFLERCKKVEEPEKAEELEQKEGSVIEGKRVNWRKEWGF